MRTRIPSPGKVIEVRSSKFEEARISAQGFRSFFELRTRHFGFRRALFYIVMVCGPAQMGCDFGAPPLDVGVGTGGAQDIAYARSIIEDGGIPDPSTITIEGFLSEHSIDLEPPEGAGDLYATATASWNTDFDELTPLITVQVGFGSTIDLVSFQRSPINLALVIDRSGSMDEDFDARTRTTKLDAVRIAIDRLLASLTAQDRVSVVAFAEQPTTLLEPVPGTDIISIKSSLEGLSPQGATNLAAGMIRGYEVLRSNQATTRSDRIMVFTDANVTAGISRSDDFLRVMRAYAEDDIGATLVGVGVDFGQHLTYEISQIRGGNFVYLSDYDRILQVFGDEFNFLVSPIATDVRLAAEIPFALDVADAYGLPNIDTSTHTVAMVIPTLFYSARQGGGAIMIRLRPGSLVDFSNPIEPAVLSLNYKSAGGEQLTSQLRLSLPAGLDPTGAESYFPTPASRRAVLLLNTALVLKNACLDTHTGYVRDDAGGSYHYPTLQDYARAVTRLTEFLPYFDSLAAGLEDQTDETSRSLAQERALVQKLLENIQSTSGIGTAFP